MIRKVCFYPVNPIDKFIIFGDEFLIHRFNITLLEYLSFSFVFCPFISFLNDKLNVIRDALTDFAFDIACRFHQEHTWSHLCQESDEIISFFRCQWVEFYSFRSLSNLERPIFLTMWVRPTEPENTSPNDCEKSEVCLNFHKVCSTFRATSVPSFSLILLMTSGNSSRNRTILTSDSLIAETRSKNTCL